MGQAQSLVTALLVALNYHLRRGPTLDPDAPPRKEELQVPTP